MDANIVGHLAAFHCSINTVAALNKTFEIENVLDYSESVSGQRFLIGKVGEKCAGSGQGNNKIIQYNVIMKTQNWEQ